MKKILVPLATGFEEIEAVTIIDVLRRSGADVITAGIEKRNVVGSHDIHLLADSVIEEEAGKSWDLIVLPGGVPGTPNMAGNDILVGMLKKHAGEGGLTAAICAAPSILDDAGILTGKKSTIHPDWANRLKNSEYTGERVQVDGNVITGMSAGTAMEFAFELVTTLYGQAKAEELNQGISARL